MAPVTTILLSFVHLIKKFAQTKARDRPTSRQTDRNSTNQRSLLSRPIKRPPAHATPTGPQYGLANLHDPQAHIYDDLEVVSQSNGLDCAGDQMLKFGQQQQQLNKQAANRHQQAAIYAASRELYEPTTKLVIGSNGHQLQQQQQQQQSLNLSHLHSQQQQARAKFFKERAEDEFHDDE